MVALYFLRVLSIKNILKAFEILCANLKSGADLGQMASDQKLYPIPIFSRSCNDGDLFQDLI